MGLPATGRAGLQIAALSGAISSLSWKLEFSVSPTLR